MKRAWCTRCDWRGPWQADESTARDDGEWHEAREHGTSLYVIEDQEDDLGAQWAAAQEPTDAEVEAAARALYAEDVNESYIEWPAYDSPQNVGRELYVERARNALSAARAARRDEEKRDV